MWEGQASTERVNLFQIFLCLAVFCEGTVHEKARFCFEIFDVDRSGTLQPVELTKFIFVIVESLYLIGEMTQRPKDSAMHQLARWCFQVGLSRTLPWLPRAVLARVL